MSDWFLSCIEKRVVQALNVCSLELHFLKKSKNQLWHEQDEDACVDGGRKLTSDLSRMRSSFRYYPDAVIKASDVVY